MKTKSLKSLKFTKEGVELANMTVQHTPTPWGVELSTIYKTPVMDWNELDHQTGDDIVGSTISHADAAFVIRAVNAHEELIALLGEIHYKHANSLKEGLAVRIIQAIAKAEGK